MNSRQPDVLYEDNHLIVVNKPPLIPTMGVAAGEESMVTIVKEYLRVRYQKPGNVFLGVVSRLDAHSCGVLVFARTSKAAERLSEQFRTGIVTKTYWAIVEGEIPETEGEMSDWMRKNEQEQRMVVSRRGAAGAKPARLAWKKLGSHGGNSLLEVDLQTGRKHQIRLQFSSRGFPILGDRKYNARARFSGIALMAKSLSLLHPVRKCPMDFCLEPPGNWKIRRFLNK
jgi:23S rRNA pseudouridine1911/1915/1917 synthase